MDWQGGIYMTGRYEILRGSESIGLAEVTREGLYYRFRCRCKLTGAVIYKITVQMGSNLRDLGVLVPENDIFALETRVPAKYFGTGDPRFFAVPHNKSPAAEFIPISPDEPFVYLARLRKAYMAKQNGITGIVLEN